MSKIQPKSKPRLGRGLSSLISVSELPVEAELPQAPSLAPSISEPAEGMIALPEGQPAEIAIDAISPNPHQPRKTFDETALRDLAASFKSTGIIQPLVVRREGDTYQLIAGERRWRAARLAGLATVPVLIREVDGFNQAQMALVENIQREDLNPIDRATAYRALIDALGLTQAELAGRLGEDRSSIANFLRLLDLSQPVRELVQSGEISLGHAKLLAGAADAVEQQRLAQLVITQALSVRNLERLIQDAPAETQTCTPAPAPSAHLQDMEKSISRQLGMRVQVRSGKQKGRGRMVIHYASLDQFDQLIGRLGVSLD